MSVFPAWSSHLGYLDFALDQHKTNFYMYLSSASTWDLFTYEYMDATCFVFILCVLSAMITLNSPSHLGLLESLVTILSRPTLTRLPNLPETPDVKVIIQIYPQLDFFLPYQFWKKIWIYQVRFLFGWVLKLILIHAILEQSINNKMVSKI